MIWSVWKHSGFKDRSWMCIVEDWDEPYVRHVYRFVMSGMKEGFAQLREGSEVREEKHFPRMRKGSGAQRDELVVHPDIFTGLKEIRQLAAVNPILEEVYRQYENGGLSHLSMLELAVRRLADYDIVMRYVEDRMWESPDYNVPSEKITNKKVAMSKAVQFFEASEKNVELAIDALEILNPHPVYIMVLERIIADIAASKDLVLNDKFQEQF